MAELPRYQRAGNRPEDIPQLSLSNVKEAARLTSGMSSALDKVSAFAFGAVKERIDEENKIVGIQMRGELELLANEKMAEFKQKLQTGGYQSHEDMRQDVLSLQGLWKGLAKVDPNQASGLANSINQQSRTLVDLSADTFTKAYLADAENQMNSVAGGLQTQVSDILKTATTFEDANLRIQQLEGTLGGAISTKNRTLVPKWIEKSAKAKDAGISAFASEFVRGSADINRTYSAIISGNTGNAVMDEMLKSDKRAIIVDAAKKQMDEFRDAELARETTTKKQIATLKADFSLAVAADNKADQNKILDQLYYLDPTGYQQMVKVRDESGGMFAQYDHGFAVAALSSKTGSVTGKILTIEDVEAHRKYLTPSTYTEYMNKARILQDAQTQEVMRRTKASLGLLVGNPLNSSAARVQNENIANEILTKWANDKLANPNLDPVQWEKDNVQAIAQSRQKQDKTALADAVVSRPIKTVQGFDDAIRKAIRDNDKGRQDQLIKQKTELQDAIKAGLVDQNGNKIGGTQ